MYPRVNAAQNAEVPYGFQITPSELPLTYTPSEQNIFASGDTKKVPANTVMDVNRYQNDLAALAPGHQLSLLNLSGIDRRFGNGFLQTWTLGLERQIGGLTADAAYVGTAAFRLPRTSFPNGFPGAGPGFAPYTNFDDSGAVTGGFGFESVITDTSHSSYNALQTSLSGIVGHGGPGIQAGYTWSKALDDTSAVSGGTGSTGAVALPMPQNPFNTHLEKGPSNFDVAHAFTLSAGQDLHLQDVSFLSPVSKTITAGWELLSISTITSGSPFTVYSGIQQTGAGTDGTDRPDQIATPHLSTAHSSSRPREDYFGRGTAKVLSSQFPSEFRAAPAPMWVSSARWGATRFLVPRTTISTTRSSRARPSAIARAEWKGRLSSSAPSFLISSTSSTWAFPPIPSKARASASSAKQRGPRGRFSFLSSWFTNLAEGDG